MGFDSSELEIQWSVGAGGVASPSVNGCSGQAFILPTSYPGVYINVRARLGKDCPWSDWYGEEFCVGFTPGGGDGKY